MKPIRWGAAALIFLSAWVSTSDAQQARSTADEIKRYRDALGDGNPAELWEARGEALCSCASCCFVACSCGSVMAKAGE